MSHRFEFKSQHYDKYKSLYSQLVSLHELQNIFFSGLVTEEEHAEILKDILSRIRSLADALNFLNKQIEDFCNATHLSTDFIIPALQNSTEEVKGQTVLSIGQRLGNDLVVFLDDITCDKPKSTIQSTWKSAFNGLVRLNLLRQGKIKDHVESIERILTSSHNHATKLSSKNKQELISKREMLKQEIYMFLPKICNDDSGSLAFECGLKKQNFYDAVLLGEYESIKRYFDEFLFSIKKIINLEENKEASNLFDHYAKILTKYCGSQYLSEEDVNEILSTQEDVTELLFGNSDS